VLLSPLRPLSPLLHEVYIEREESERAREKGDDEFRVCMPDASQDEAQNWLSVTLLSRVVPR
jgi:hypothetical protein